MGTLVGTVLVLLTWLVCAAAVCALGLLPSVVIAGRRPLRVLLRTSLWWGLLAVTVFAYAINLVQPLRSAATAWALVAFIAVLAAPALWLLRRQGVQWRAGVGRRHFWLLWLALAMALAYLAMAALGPVTNYDSGLYHLGAIQYAGDYATVPGLANLYSALGYANAEFPLAALLGNGPWDGQGFRLLNGLILALVALDFVIRGRQRRLSAGFFVLAIGLLAALVPMIALADYWVTSPTQDSTVMVVTIIAVAYLVDALTKRRGWVGDAGVAAALALMLILLRPTMVVFAIACLAVVVGKAWHAHRTDRGTDAEDAWKRAAVITGIATVVVGIVSAARDYVLSGWLEYPLSFFHFPVAWLAADPTPVRLSTLGYHRDRDHLWQSTEGYSWVGPWLARLPEQWESFQFGLMLLVAILAFVLVARRSASSLRWRLLALALAPSAAAIAVWFLLLPPSFRFIWGPLFMLPATVIGWCLWRLHLSDHTLSEGARGWLQLTVLAVSIPVILVTIFTLAVRSDLGASRVTANWRLGVSIPYSLVPVRTAPVQEVQLAGGLVIQEPSESDQCWSVFPLCTPLPSGTLRPRGPQLQDGFLP